MALNGSGPISLGGTTTGQSIAIELGGSGTAQISLNDTNVRTLAGVSSGAIVMPTNFWGKSNVTNAIATSNSSTPFVTVYPWSAGYGTKYSNPSTLPPGQGYGVVFNPSNTVISVSHLMHPEFLVIRGHLQVDLVQNIQTQQLCQLRGEA